MKCSFLLILVLLATNSCSDQADAKMSLKSVTPILIESQIPTFNSMQSLVSNKSLTTFVAGIKNAQLVGYLSGDGPFTIFAPTNEAFAKLPESFLEDLFNSEPEQLKLLLQYHIVEDYIRKNDMVTGLKAQTTNGIPIIFNRSDGLRINNANILLEDVITTNGVIHIIDEVMGIN